MSYADPRFKEITRWTDDEFAEAKRRYLAGESASQIARALGNGRSRCSILGKLHREGIPCPNTARPRRETAGLQFRIAIGAVRLRTARAPKPKPIPKPKPEFGNVIDLTKLRTVRVETDPVPLTSLGPDMCKFPTNDGEDLTHGWLFCGAPRPHDQKYCLDHKKLATRPVKKPGIAPAFDNRRYNGRRHGGAFPKKVYSE